MTHTFVTRPSAVTAGSAIKSAIQLAGEYRIAAIGVVILALAIGVGIFGNFIAPYDPVAGVAADRLQGPSGSHWFGTDEFGRDVLSRIILGARNSLLVSVSAVGVGTILGAALGIVSGYRGGSFDLVTQRFVDVIMALPTTVLALLLMAALGPSLTSVITAIGLGIAPRTSRVARAGALTAKENLYVEAAIAVGVPQWRVAFRHILPNLLASLITYSTTQVGGAIILESSLSFLGAGLPPESPSWGRMLTTAARYLNAAPWLAIVPGVALSLTVFSINIVGDALRDLTDPTLRRATDPRTRYRSVK